MYPLVAAIALMMVFPNFAPLGVRVQVPFLIFLLTMIVVPAAGLLLSPIAGFAVTFACVAVIGLADAVSQATLFGWAGMLPPQYTQALQLGTGVSSLFDGLLRIATKLAFAEDPRGLSHSAILFFGITCLLIVGCILSYWFVSGQPFVRHYIGLAAADKAKHAKSNKANVSEGMQMQRRGLGTAEESATVRREREREREERERAKRGERRESEEKREESQEREKESEERESDSQKRERATVRRERERERERQSAEREREREPAKNPTKGKKTERRDCSCGHRSDAEYHVSYTKVLRKARVVFFFFVLENIPPF